MLLGGHGQKVWVLANDSGSALTLSGGKMGNGTTESLSAPSLTTVVNSERILTRGSGPFDGSSFVLPPYSVSRIKVP